MKMLAVQSWPTERTLVPPPGREDLLAEELDGELVLSDPRNGHVYRLNRTAAGVWRLCDGRRSTTAMAECLTDSYDVSLSTALDHVEQLTALFGESHLIEGATE